MSDAAKLLDRILMWAEDLVETARFRIDFEFNHRDRPFETAREVEDRLREVGRIVYECEKGLQAACDEFKAANAPPEEWYTPPDRPYDPVTWREIPYWPASLAVPTIASDLLGDVAAVSDWYERCPGLDAMIEDGETLLAKWPKKLLRRLRKLRGRVEHELSTPPRDIATDNVCGDDVGDGKLPAGIVRRLREAHIQPKPLRLVREMWQQTPTEIEDLAPAVWSEEPSDNVVKQVIKKANAALQKAGEKRFLSQKDGRIRWD